MHRKNAQKILEKCILYLWLSGLGVFGYGWRLATNRALNSREAQMKHTTAMLSPVSLQGMHRAL